jgi:hypothetical protein
MLPAIIGVLGVAGVGGAILSDMPRAALAAEAPAGPGAAPADTKAGPAERRARFMPGRHIEGRIAFLHAELKITPAQKAQWDNVATVMRDNAKSDTALFEQARTERAGKPDALARMNARVKFSEARLATTKKFLEAFAPLYQSLSDEQKQTADELFGPRGHRMMRG